MLKYSQYSEIVENAVQELPIPVKPAGLYDPVRYILDGGGKRLRPVLTLAACDACGAEPGNALSQAVGLEMFHNFTLLHDDVMDKADMRRGRPTVHLRWNEQTAILSGDAMLTLATQMIGKCDDASYRPAMELFNKTALEVYEGQQLDMDFERELGVTESQYLEMIRLKTSVLLGCACRMGAIIAGCDEACGKALYDFGETLGIAFQLRDDMLDTYGDPIIFGKRVGGDIINDKKTWLLITALNDDETGRLREIITTGHPDGEDKVIAVREIYDKYDIKARCEKLIADYSSRAIDIINNSSLPSDGRRFFIDLAQNTAGRTH